jgi:hypothetical protein
LPNWNTSAGRDEVCSLGQKHNGEAVHVEFHSWLISRTFIATVSATLPCTLKSSRLRKEVRSSSIIRLSDEISEKLVYGRFAGPRLATPMFVFYRESLFTPGYCGSPVMIVLSLLESLIFRNCVAC